MRYTEKDIIQLIHDTVWEVTQIKVVSDDISLLDAKLGINPADFLYVFEIFEKKLEIPVIDIFKNNNYLVMKVSNLSKAFYNILENKEKVESSAM